jgi:hypothetical protein
MLVVASNNRGKECPVMRQDEREAAVAAFIRSKGVTRCPTACALPTQGTIAAADRAALQNYVTERAKPRRQKIDMAAQSWWGVGIPTARGE